MVLRNIFLKKKKRTHYKHEKVSNFKKPYGFEALLDLCVSARKPKTCTQVQQFMACSPPIVLKKTKPKLQNQQKKPTLFKKEIHNSISKSLLTCCKVIQFFFRKFLSKPQSHHLVWKSGTAMLQLFCLPEWYCSKGR